MVNRIKQALRTFIFFFFFSLTFIKPAYARANVDLLDFDIDADGNLTYVCLEIWDMEKTAGNAVFKINGQTLTLPMGYGDKYYHHFWNGKKDINYLLDAVNTDPKKNTYSIKYMGVSLNRGSALADMLSWWKRDSLSSSWQYDSSVHYKTKVHTNYQDHDSQVNDGTQGNSGSGREINATMDIYKRLNVASHTYTWSGWTNNASNNTRTRKHYCTVCGYSDKTETEQLSKKFDLQMLLPNGSEAKTGAAGYVNFSSNGGSSYSKVSNEPASSYSYNTHIKIKDIAPATGLHFASASPSNYSDFYLTSDVTVKIKMEWNTYTIAFDKNGGSGSMSSMSRTYNDSAKNLTANKFSRTGYTFTGWNTKSDGSGTSYSDGQSVRNLTAQNGATVTLYAQWKTISYTISYNMNGDSVSSNPSTYNVETATFTLKNPAKTGYTFTGWTGSNGTTPQTSVIISKGSTGNRSYTANWRANTYKIEFISSSDKVGDVVSSSTGSIVTGTMAVDGPYAYDQSYNLPKNQFVRTGYTFAGWTQNKDGSGKVFPNEGQFRNLTAADNGVVQLYAKWSVKKYTIKYILHGFTLQNPVTEYTVEDSILISDPTSPDPSRKEFKKWISYEAGAGDLMPGCRNIGYKNNIMTVPKGTYGNLTFEVEWKPVGKGIYSSETVVNHFRIVV